MKSLKVNAFAAILVRVLNIIFPLITGPYIARTLAKENIALFDGANTIAQLFIPFASFGIYTYGVRSISKIKNDKTKINKLFSELFYLSIFSSVLTTTIYICYASFSLAAGDTISLYIYYILGFQILAQIIYIEWINEAFENYTFILYKTIFVRIITFTLVFVFIRDADDVIPYVTIMTLAEVFNSIISFIWIKREVKFVKVKIKNILKLITSLFTILLLSNINMLYTYLDKIFLTKSPVSTYISDYVIALNIVMLIIGVISGAISVNVPRLSYYLGQNDKKSYENLINKGSQAFLFFVVPISFGLMILGTEATLIYGGEKFIIAGVVTSLFAVRSIIWAVDNILGIQIMFVQGYEKSLTVCISIGGIVNLALNYFLYYCQIFEPKYYILTTIIAESIVLICYIIFIRKNKIIDLSFIFKSVFKYSIIASTFLIVNFLVNSIIYYDMVVNFQMLFIVAVKIVLCGLLYTVILYIFKDDLLFSTISYLSKKIIKVNNNKKIK